MFLLTFPYIGLLRANFMRPAASRLLLSRFLPYPIGFPPLPLALEAEASRFWVPQENGARKRRTIQVLPIC